MSESEIGIQEQNTQPKNEYRRWGYPSDEEIDARVKELSSQGVPDTVIAQQLHVGLSYIRKSRERNHLQALSPQASRDGRRKFVRENPVKELIFEDPPLEEDNNF